MSIYVCTTIWSSLWRLQREKTNPEEEDVKAHVTPPCQLFWVIPNIVSALPVSPSLTRNCYFYAALLANITTNEI